MSELPRGLRPRRRWPMLLAGVLGLLAVSGWWWAPDAVQAAVEFIDADLQTKDRVSSIISMLVGVVSLVISVLLGVVQLVRNRHDPTAPLMPWAPREGQAADRLRAFLGRQNRLLRIGDRRTSALALRVHSAIDAPSALPATFPWWRRLAGHWASTGDGLHPSPPTFVERDKEDQVRGWMRHTRTSGGFLILVGDSCVGKTRLLYETARTELSDFVVLAPDLGDGGLVNTIAQASFPLPKLIVWLDELQRFLPGPYLTDGSTPITAAAVRQLLDAPNPVIILATLWPAYATTLRADDQPDDSTGPLARYPEAVDILTDRRVHEIRLDTFSSAERTTATRLAAHDPRLAAAVADRDYNISEALAGARELIDRYQRATAIQHAVLHAAVDARRVGIQAPFTEQLLCAAARGYLPTVHPDDAWFPTALHELTSSNRPQDKATAPLIPIASPDRRTTLGYTIADYLLQHLTQQRRTKPIPNLTWQAFNDHTHHNDDLTRLADNAARRLLYTHAITIYQRLASAGDEDATAKLANLLAEQGRVDDLRTRADTGDGHAAWRLADLLARHGRTDEAIEVLRARADTGDGHNAWRLADLLARHGRTDEAIEVLRARADTGDARAAARLADLLANQSRVDDLRARADDGDGHAARQLAGLLLKRGRVDELRARANAGDGHAARQLAGLLARQDRIDEAVAVLRARADAGEGHAARQLAGLLADQGRVDDLRARADAGDEYATAYLADLLAEHVDDLNSQAAANSGYSAARMAGLLARQGRIDEAIAVLRARADTGDEYAAAHLADLLTDQGRVDELHARADAGDVPAAARLAGLLAKQGRIDEAIAVLRARADNQFGFGYFATPLINLLTEQSRVDDLRAEVCAGTYGAADRLLRILARQGKGELIEQIRRCGLEPEDAPNDPR